MLIIFDCDGVLVESETILVSAEMEFLASLGFEFTRDEYIHRFMGMPTDTWKRQVRELVGAASMKSGFFDGLHDSIQRKLSQEMTAVEGARVAIEGIRDDKCVASSSSPEELTWKLDHAGLLDLFEPHLFSTFLVEHGKPAPDLFLLAAESMGVAPSNCVVIEDSSNGIIAAKRAGMHAIGFTGGSHCPPNHGDVLRADGADLVVTGFDQLRTAIR